MRRSKKPTVASRIIQGLGEFADALEKKQPIRQKFTCRKVVLDLRPSTYDAAAVKQTRRMLGASQTVFARFLGVSPSTVRAWEHGDNVPSDLASRFMDEIRRDPEHWLGRLQESIRSE